MIQLNFDKKKQGENKKTMFLILCEINRINCNKETRKKGFIFINSTGFKE